jgi:4-nitrophenyl phosphatase
MSSTRLATIQSLIVDMDGVLYRLNTPIEGAAEFLTFLRQTERPFLLVTNNSTLTPEQYVAKLAQMGIVIESNRILTSGEATAIYLAGQAPPGTRIYVIGENGIRTALDKRGFLLVDDVDVPYVVVALDRQLTYSKLATACLAIRRGARFIATNPDKTLPTEQGLLPGARAIFTAIQVATDTAPLVIGKPEPAMLELALSKLSKRPNNTAIVGDGLETDIPGGRRLGLTTILVLSGVTSPEQLAQSAIKPDLVFRDVASLHATWAKSQNQAISRKGERHERPPSPD